MWLAVVGLHSGVYSWDPTVWGRTVSELAFLGHPVWRLIAWGLLLGACHLGATDCEVVNVLTIRDPTVWGPSFSGDRNHSWGGNHLLLRRNVEDPSTLNVEGPTVRGPTVRGLQLEAYS